MKAIKFITILVVLACSSIGCSDDDDNSQVSSPNEINATVTSGGWIVTLFKEDNVVQTDNFSGYVFTFAANGDLSATNGSTTQSGDWSTYSDSGYTKLDLMFDALDGPFEEISEDWRVISRTVTKIELKHVSGGDGSVDFLTFEKN
jgi:hypothetical protein